MLSPEQLAVLAEAGAPSVAVAGAEVDEVGTFQLQKGRLDVTDDGSTVIMRGGHDYDSDTGTVTVSTPLEQGPDGLLTDSDGVVRPLPMLLHVQAAWGRLLGCFQVGDNDTAGLCAVACRARCHSWGDIDRCRAAAGLTSRYG